MKIEKFNVSLFLLLFLFTQNSIATKFSMYSNFSKKDSIKETKYWNSFSTNIISVYAFDPWIIGGNYVGAWGFVDPDLDKQFFGGYQIGLSFSYRPLKHFDLFYTFLFSQFNVLLGKENHQLEGIAIWSASGGTYDRYSPPLPQDIYYISKVYMGKFGGRIILPIEKILEPFLGCSFDISSYQIGFGNKNGSRAYSNIVNDIGMSFSLILGFNINILSNNSIILKINPFLELGGLVTESGVEIQNWIWQNWTYSNQFIVVPHYRMGILIGM